MEEQSLPDEVVNALVEYIKSEYEKTGDNIDVNIDWRIIESRLRKAMIPQNTPFNLGSLNIDLLNNLLRWEIASDMFTVGTDYIRVWNPGSKRCGEYIYGAPEYIASEYRKVMDRISDYLDIDLFSINLSKPSEYDFFNISHKKDALRRYIMQNGGDIDIQVPTVQFASKQIERIARAIQRLYPILGQDNNSLEELKELISNKYPEIYSERQAIKFEDLLGDNYEKRLNPEGIHSADIDDIAKMELSVLYVYADFIYISGGDEEHECCVYATPQALQREIEALNASLEQVSIEEERSGEDGNEIRARIERRKKELERFKENNLLLVTPGMVGQFTANVPQSEKLKARYQEGGLKGVIAKDEK